MLCNRLAWVGLAVVAMAATPACADNRQGVDLWRRGDAFGAVNEFRSAAIAGDPEAQYNLARAYQQGRGVPLDLKLAESWYGRAAAQGHLPSRNKYGLILFQNGDRQGAMPYIEEAAGRGEPAAQYVLGTALFNGDGVKKDWVRSYALMTQAAAGGIPQASASLAQMDRYIPAEQRQRGLTMARAFERAPATQLAGNLIGEGAGSSPTSARPIVREELPPSEAGAPPVPVAPPVRTRSVRVASPSITRPVRVATATPPRQTVETSPTREIAATSTAPHWARPEEVPPPMAPTAAGVGGKWKVQLAAFGDPGKANGLWANLHGRIGALRPYRQFVDHAGPITRLQAGPLPSSAAAAKLCTAVRAAGQPCIPVAP